MERNGGRSRRCEVLQDPGERLVWALNSNERSCCRLVMASKTL